MIMSTQFQHKQIRKDTWISPDQNTINQIDHVVINANKKEIIEDVRFMRWPNIDSNHFLLEDIIKQKLPKIYWRKITQTKKCNKVNLQNPLKLKQYKTFLYNKLEQRPEVDDIEEEWQRLKIAITEAANETT
jgi:hypothetical protein